jgi:hypothetical protein
MKMNLVVGQRVEIHDAYSHKITSCGVVKRITPSGQFIIECMVGEELHELRFNKHGKEMGRGATSYPGFDDYLVAVK